MANKFADVYILPIKEENLAAYRKMAQKASKIFIKHGALKYREYVGKNLAAVAEWGLIPFTKNAKAKEGELVVYAAVEFKSEKHRDQVMKKVFADADMGCGEGEMPFQMKRMAYGGFEVIVEAEAE
jgi:alkaline phosphatase